MVSSLHGFTPEIKTSTSLHFKLFKSACAVAGKDVVHDLLAYISSKILTLII